MRSNLERLEEVTEALAQADALLVGAGAGMGVDAGLPDYRGTLGVWTSRPDWEELASGRWFTERPRHAWGAFGAQFALFARALPHAGYAALRSIAARMRRGVFVYSSNVDGHFERAGFHPEAILECHGSMHYLQCSWMCSRQVWRAPRLTFQVEDGVAHGTLPRCPRCDRIARPNVLLFGDNLWTCSRHAEQMKRYVAWREGLQGARLVVLELGAGTVIPSVREQCEHVAHERDGVLVRVNPFEAECDEGISLPMGACAALTQLDRMLLRAAGGV